MTSRASDLISVWLILNTWLPLCRIRNACLSIATSNDLIFISKIVSITAPPIVVVEQIILLSIIGDFFFANYEGGQYAAQTEKTVRLPWLSKSYGRNLLCKAQEPGGEQLQQISAQFRPQQEVWTRMEAHPCKVRQSASAL